MPNAPAMPDYVGPPRILEISSLLWLAVLAPLIGWRLLLLAGPASEKRTSAMYTLGGVLPSAVSLCVVVAMIPKLADGGEVLGAAWSLLDLGSLSLSVGVALDRAATLVAFLIASAGMGLGAFVAQGEDPRRTMREIGRLNTVVAGALLCVMADGVVTLLLGALVGTVAVWLTLPDGAPTSPRPLAAVLLGAPLLVGFASILVWTFSGTWLDGMIVPDVKPRVVAVEPRTDYRTVKPKNAEGQARATGSASLTMLGPAGATVTVDGTALPMQPPFVKHVMPAGAHAVVVSMGEGAEEGNVNSFRVEDNHEARLVRLGPSFVFRDLVEQVQSRTMGGSPLEPGPRLPGALAALLGSLSLLGFSLVIATRAKNELTSSQVLSGLIPAIVPTLVVARMVPVMGASPALAGALAMAALVLAVYRGLAGSTSLDARGVLVDAGTVQILLGLAGAACGVPSLAMVAIGATFVAVCAGCAALDASSTSEGALDGARAPLSPVLARLHGGACITLAAATPGGAAFWIAGGLAHGGFNEKVMPTWAGAIVLVLVVLASAVQTFAMWRAHHLLVSPVMGTAQIDPDDKSSTKKKRKKGKKASDATRDARSTDDGAEVGGPASSDTASRATDDDLGEEASIGTRASKKGATASNESASAAAGAGTEALIGMVARRVFLSLLAVVALISAEPLVAMVAAKPIFWGWINPPLGPIEPPSAAKVGLLAIVVMLPSFLTWTRARTSYGPERPRDWVRLEMARPLARWLALVPAVLIAASSLWPSTAVAQPTTQDVSRAQIRSLVVSPGGALELLPGKGAFEGSVFVTNAGKDSVDVGVELLSSEADPRLPAGVSASFNVDSKRNAPSTTIEPGKQAALYVRWDSTRSRQIELHGGVALVARGERTVIEIEAERRGPIPSLSSHLVSALVLIPLLGAIAVAIAARVGERRDRTARRLGLGFASAQVILIALTFVRFVPGLGRGDGVDGLQMVERTSFGDVLLFVGLDGASLMTVMAIGLVPLLALLATPAAMPGMARAIESVLAGVGLATLALVSQDLALVATGWCLLCALLIRELHPLLMGRTRLVLGGALTLSAIALCGVAIVLGRTAPVVSDAGWAHGRLSIVTLVRADLLAAPHVLGQPAITVAWTMLMIAAVLPALLLIVPGVGDQILERGARPVSIALPSLLPAVAMVLLVRWGVMVLPEGVRWSAVTLSAAGIGCIVLGATSAWRATTLGGLAAPLLGAQIGVALVGLGSLTTQGIGAALMMATAHVLTTCVLVTTSRMLSEGAACSEIARFGGLLEDERWYVVCVAMIAGWLAVAGAPFLPSGWALASTLYGAMGTQRWAAILTGLFVAVSAARLARVVGGVLLGPVPEAWHRSERLEPSGGKFPSIDAGERAVLVVLVALLVPVGGLTHGWMAPLERAALDASAFVGSALGPQ